MTSSTYLMAWAGAGLECLGKVAEHEADAAVGEEQVRRELGARGPLLFLLLALAVLWLRWRPIVGPVPLRRRHGGPRLGVEAGGGGGMTGFGGCVGVGGGGRSGGGGAVAGPVARAAALEAARGRRRGHGWGQGIGNWGWMDGSCSWHWARGEEMEGFWRESRGEMAPRANPK